MPELITTTAPSPQKALEIVEKANWPEEVFGWTPQEGIPISLSSNVLWKPNLEEFLSKRVAMFAEPIETLREENALAVEKALLKLKTLREQAISLAEKGIFALPGRIDFAHQATGKKFSKGDWTYYLGKLIHDGLHCKTTQGFLEIEGKQYGQVVFRVAHSSANNDMLKREQRTIEIFNRSSSKVDQSFSALFPKLIDRFYTDRKPGDVGRLVLVYRMFPGFSLETIRKDRLYRKGIEAHHAAWMLSRGLIALSVAHAHGIVHGEVTPWYLMVHPSTHFSILTGWAQAAYRPAQTKEKIEFANEHPYLAPEVLENDQIGPQADIFSLGKTMIFALGGNPETNEIPESVPEEFAYLIKRMTLAPRGARPDSAKKLELDLQEIRDSLWGKGFKTFPWNS